MKKTITLAIETAVGNGSFSLFAGDSLLDELAGDRKISRADSFLPILSEFLQRNNLDKRNLEKVAVSCGPGSFTGARIGLTTALALRDGLNLEFFCISVLRALFLSVTSESSVITAVLNDKSEVIWQKFFRPAAQTSIKAKSLKEENLNRVPDEQAGIIDFDAFIKRIPNENSYENSNTLILLEERLYKKIIDLDEKKFIGALADKNITITNVGNNLSAYIGRALLKGCASDNPKIVYLDTNKKYTN